MRLRGGNLIRALARTQTKIPDHPRGVSMPCLENFSTSRNYFQGPIRRTFKEWRRPLSTGASQSGRLHV